MDILENKLKLNSILLLVLVTPFIMTYALGPKETPYWLFGLIFLGLLLYLVLDLLRIKNDLYLSLKQTVFWLIVVLAIGSAFTAAIIVRHQTAPVYGVHDIILQLESAIQFFLSGKNPYSATYFGTPLEQWPYSATEINPALYHFVMLPFYLLFSTFFYFISITFLGFFDARLPLYFLFFMVLILMTRLVKDKVSRLTFLILLAFNPATLGYLLEGRDDIFMMAFLLMGLFLLQKKRLALAGIPMALAFATKQSVWPIFPFYMAFLWFQTSDSRNLTPLIRRKALLILGITFVFKNLLPFATIFGLIVLPFFFWDQKAYLESTIFYLSGNAPHSYPIAGYGLGSMLLQFGVISNKFASYPFWLWQALICLPLAGILIWWQKKENTVQRFLISYGIFLFVFWYLSRYFNNSHLGFISMIFVIACFWPKKV